MSMVSKIRKGVGVDDLPIDSEAMNFIANQAGRIFAHAALGNRLPITTEFTLIENSQAVNALDSLSWERRGLSNEACSEWYLISLLAGDIAQFFLGGDIGMQSESEEAYKLLHEHLEKYSTETFVKKPKDMREFFEHDRIVEIFLDNQRGLLEDFFFLNKEVFKELHSALLDKKRLNSNEAAVFFRRVKFPEGFPLYEENLLE